MLRCQILVAENCTQILHTNPLDYTLHHVESYPNNPNQNRHYERPLSRTRLRMNFSDLPIN